MMKKVKKRWIVFGAIALVMAVIFIADLVKYPISGSLYDLTRIKKEDIAEVQITHYGKTAQVSDRKELDQMIALFDCNLKRLGNDYIGHMTGGDWYIVFLTDQGYYSRGFSFFSRGEIATSADDQIKIDHYYYACDKTLTQSLIEGFWDAEFKKD